MTSILLNESDLIKSTEQPNKDTIDRTNNRPRIQGENDFPVSCRINSVVYKKLKALSRKYDRKISWLMNASLKNALFYGFAVTPKEEDERMSIIDAELYNTSVRIEPMVYDKLMKISRKTDRSLNWLVNRALFIGVVRGIKIPVE